MAAAILFSAFQDGGSNEGTSKEGVSREGTYKEGTSLENIICVYEGRMDLNLISNSGGHVCRSSVRASLSRT